MSSIFVETKKILLLSYEYNNHIDLDVASNIIYAHAHLLQPQFWRTNFEIGRAVHTVNVKKSVG